MPHPSMRCLLIIAAIALGGCEAFELNFGKPAESAPATAKPAAKPKLRIAVLDSNDIYQSKARHKKGLLQTGKYALLESDVGYYMDVQKAQFIQVLQNENIAIDHEGNRIILKLPGADSFGSGSVRLKSKAQKILSSISQVLNEFKKTQITIHGHTDDTGEEAYNQKLSERRALSVARHLVDSGIAKERFAIVGYGESQPASSNETPDGRAKNRRIELHLDPIAND